MRLAVEREALYTALSKVAKIVPKNAPNPVLSFVKVEAVDGELFVSATDLSTRIVAQTIGQLRIEDEGACLLPATGMFMALRASNAPFLALATDGSAGVQMGIGRTSYRWRTLPTDHFPDILALNTEAESHILGKESFLSAVAAVRTAVQQGADARFDQVAVRNGLVQAADGNRYHQAWCEDASALNVDLPVDFLTDMTSLAGSSKEGKITIGLSEDRKAISARVGSTILMTRAQAEPFPNINQVFVNAQMTNQQPLEVDRDGLLGAVRRVRMVADVESGAVALKLSEGQVQVSARQQSGSRAIEPLEAAWEGEERTLVVHHSHLIALLEMFSTNQVKLMIGPDIRNKPGSVYIADPDRIGVVQQLRMRWFDDSI